MGVVWGVPYLLIKVADGGVSVPVLVFARTSIGALVLLPLALRRGVVGQMRAHWRWLSVFALVEIILPWALLSDAERRLASSLSGMLVASVPVIGAVLALATRSSERLTLLRWTGLALGFGGVVLLAGPTAHGGDARAVAEVLLTATGYAVGPVILSRKLSEAPSLGVTVVCLAGAAVIYAPLAAATWPHAVPSGRVLAALAVLGVVCTGAAFVGFLALIAETDPARATVITYVNPMVAVALGVALLGERLTPVTIVSFALILAGSFLATRAGRSRAPATARPVPPQPAGPGYGAAAVAALSDRVAEADTCA
jgi:drug/metabolite transporter (DMT)-like permease